MATDPPPTHRLAAVTGASGYLGQNLVPVLLAQGWSVRALDRRPPEPGRRRPPTGAANGPVDEDRIEVVEVDVRDRAGLEPALDGVDVVFHLAAKISLATEDPEVWDINVHGPAAVAAAARAAGVRRLVHCSSVHAFDLARNRRHLDERGQRSISPDRPIYDRSKAAGEVEVQRVIAEGLDGVIVNPTGIIGPIDPGPSRINSALRDAARGLVPLVPAGGFDWVDVRDVVAGLLAAAEAGVTGENYLLPGHRASALEIARIAARLRGHRGPVAAVPLWAVRAIAPLAEHVGRWFSSDVVTPASVGALVDDPIVDGSKAAEVLGHHPRPLGDTIRDLIDWFEVEVQLTPS